MSAPERFWTGRSLTVVGLLGFAVLLAGARLADPTRGNNGEAGADLADVSAHPTAFFVSTVLVLASTISVLAAAGGLWRLGFACRRKLATVGAGLIGLGALGNAALVTFNGFLYEMRSGDPASMVSLLDQVNNGVLLLLVFPLLLCLTLGFVLASISLWRAGLVPVGAMILTCVAFVGDFFGGAVPAGSQIVTGLVVVTFGWLAVVMGRLPGTTWDPPGPVLSEPERAPMSP